MAEPASLERAEALLALWFPADLDDASMAAMARGLPKVAAAIEGKSVVREVVVPGRLVNLVVK